MLPYGCLRGVNQPGSVRIVEVVESRLRQMLVPLLGQIAVDDAYYRKNNPDVDEKIKSGEVPSAQAHYRAAGYFEDRLPRAIAVDERWYLAEYPDVAVAVEQRHFFSGSHHFRVEGFREGRMAHAGWSLVGAADSADPPPATAP